MSPLFEFLAAVRPVILADATVVAKGITSARDGGLPQAYPSITLGPWQARPLEAAGVKGSTVFLQVNVWFRASGRDRDAAEVCLALQLLLHGTRFSLPTHAISRLEVEAWEVVEDPDGITSHGFLTLEADVEAA